MRQTPMQFRQTRPLTGYEQEQILFRQWEKDARTPCRPLISRLWGLWVGLVAGGRTGGRRLSPRARPPARPRP